MRISRFELLLLSPRPTHPPQLKKVALGVTFSIHAIIIIVLHSSAPTIRSPVLIMLAHTGRLAVRRILSPDMTCGSSW